MTEVQTIVHEVHSKVVEVQGLTLDANVKVDVGLIVEEVTKLVSVSKSLSSRTILILTSA